MWAPPLFDSAVTAEDEQSCNPPVNEPEGLHQDHKAQRKDPSDDQNRPNQENCNDDALQHGIPPSRLIILNV